MSKKQTRSVSRSNGGAPTTASNPAVSAPSARSSAYTTEFNPDYTPIVKGLKRIGTLAVTFLAILVVLSFFIH
jgi:hypothetical protein